jgi:hypothetical protein
MKYKLIILFICLLILSCSGKIKTSLHFYIFSATGNENIIHLKIRLPKGFDRTNLVCDAEKETDFIYPDSSIFFIANQVNWALPGSNRISSRNLISQSNKLTIYGGINDGLFWKFAMDSGLSYGYMTKNEKRRIEFEAVLQELKERSNYDNKASEKNQVH